jgi:radical SAM-linked protein
MRIRITFAKTEAMRYTGHLDLHRTLERSFRRAQLPLAYSQGYHPQPRLNLAAALPLGFTSQAEILDAWLEQDVSIEDIRKALEPALPPGIQILSIEEVDPHLPALQTEVKAIEYEVTLLDPASQLTERIAGLNSSESLHRERRGKPYDLRPLILDLRLIPTNGYAEPCLRMLLKGEEGATGRPEEVLAALDLDPNAARVHRTKIVF